MLICWHSWGAVLVHPSAGCWKIQPTMLKAIILGFNGKELQIDNHGNPQSVHTGTLPTESEASDGYYDLEHTV